MKVLLSSLLLFVPTLIFASKNDEKIASGYNKAFNIAQLKTIIDAAPKLLQTNVTSHLYDEDGDVEDDDYPEKYDDYNEGPNVMDLFEIHSMVSSYDGWCLEEKFEDKSKQSLVAATCDGSFSQKWFVDWQGYLHNAKFPDKCIKRNAKKLVAESCSNSSLGAIKGMRWIFATDGTLRLGSNALYALSIHTRYNQSSMWSKKRVPVALTKLKNRFPDINEQWLMVFPEHDYKTNPPTFHPTINPSQTPSTFPTYHLSIQPTRKPNSPSSAQTNYPFVSPSFHPTPSRNDQKESNHPFVAPYYPPVSGTYPHPDSHGFHINLLNMGTETAYDYAFHMAKIKLEQIIIDDLVDMTHVQDPNHDWLGNNWPNNQTNGFIDDVLIGYEITDIDGIDNTLGFAGPIYYRKAINSTNGAESFTTISGVMKFDIVDFTQMKNEDINLVVLHEMVHVLGLGTLWGEARCAQTCDLYECPKAKNMYAQLFSNTSNYLTVASKDCAHWSEQSFSSYNSSEIMTPYFEKDKYQPFSRVSVAALADLGYKVNMAAADPLGLVHYGPDDSYGRGNETVSNYNGTDNYYGYYNHVDGSVQGDTNNSRSLKEIDLQRPSKSFVLDSSNIIVPKAMSIDVIF